MGSRVPGIEGADEVASVLAVEWRNLNTGWQATSDESDGTRLVFLLSFLTNTNKTMAELPAERTLINTL